MRTGHPSLQAQALGFKGQGFDVARVRVVRFVAVHVYPQAALGGQFAQELDAQGAVGHGALKVRNAAHHVHAPVKGALERVHVLLRPGLAAQHAVLRKGHELHINIGRDAPLDFEQRVHRQQARVAHIDMGANGQQALGHRPVAIGHGALDQRLLREQGLEFAPQRNAFEQRARGVDARHAVAQRGVHVEMRVNKRRAEQLALRVQRLMRRGQQAGAYFGDAAVLHRHRHMRAPVGQGGVVDEQIEHLAFAFAVGFHQCLRIARPAGHQHQRQDGQHIGQHQVHLVG